MFKAEWEKTSTSYQLPKDIVEKMLALAFPAKNLLFYEVIPGGCANLNIKFFFEHETVPLLLRVYLRDSNAAYREQKLAQLLKNIIPVPLIYFIGNVEGHQFAIMEFITGITLRDLLLNGTHFDLYSVMHEVGTMLAKLTHIPFAYTGFFDKNLNVLPHTLPDDCLTYDKECLAQEAVIMSLPSSTISNIHKALNQYAYAFPDMATKHLVHGDFDPANILVNTMHDEWKITAILDWEFAFSGSVLWDVANMLRYAHKMPLEFQEGFLQGLTEQGVTLPKNWPVTVNILNLSCLLDSLTRTNPKTHPKQCADIHELIELILVKLSQSS
jgi:aminoglycoside phosphotransferase (APT) family kinase protein